MGTESRTSKDYTVGWVCALPKEQTTAIAMLDQRHPDLPRLPNDNNTYTLGSIGNHNIVVTCLPKGKIGTVPAATVAAQMVNAFPSIKFGLMVGIGGGVSVKVRLGDVVVGTPTGQYPGVVQWDMGKEEGNGFTRTGSLNNPPSLLLGAVSKLAAEHELGASKIQAHMNDMVMKYPSLASKYLKSESLVDIRFKAKYDHKTKGEGHITSGDINTHSSEEEDEEEDEESCRYCDKTQVVRRKLRSQGMLVHYGSIASGNRVIKNANFRDRLRQDLEGDVLCVEMAAAGLMDTFPCIVIRGICDYADSHKNKDWQEHAAAIAAAFAKELLGYVQPSDIASEPTAKDMLDSIESIVSSINENVEHTRHYLDKEEDLKILNWFARTNYGSQQTDYFRRRQSGTGQWLLNSKEYRDWTNGTNKTLFCPGIPGAGKTILTSIVVNDLKIRFRQDPTVAVSYVYCNYKHHNEQTVENLLSSLLKQLALGLPILPDSLRQTHDRHGAEQTRPSLDEIFKAIESVASRISRVFIVVDALDECQTSENCRSRFLSKILELQTKHRVNVLVTSRPIPEVEEQFKDTASIKIRATEDDIHQYLRGHFSELGGFLVDRSDLRDKITTSVAKAADGMFLLAQLYFDSLKGKDTPRAILKALEELETNAISDADKQTKKYDTAYDHAMERIEGQLQEQASRAKQVLLWIICAKRPLTTLELQHALAVEIDELQFDRENIPQAIDSVSVCAGLVTIDEESNIARLVHYTTQDYFVRNQDRWFPDAHLCITSVCATYLSYRDFEGRYTGSEDELQHQLQLYPLYGYAVQFWGHHAREVRGIPPIIISFLRRTAQVGAAGRALITQYKFRLDINVAPDTPSQTNGLHLAAHFGLDEIIRSIIGEYDANILDDYGYTALYWAVRNGHKAVVELLFASEGVDPSKGHSRGCAPFHVAVRNGDKDMINLLLDNKRVDPNMVDHMGSTPLYTAVLEKNTAVIKLLLDDKRVDPNLGYKRPLFKAVEIGHIAVIKLLLDDKRVDPNLRDSYGWTPLVRAAFDGNEVPVRILLEAGADVDAVTTRGFNALTYAVFYLHYAVERLLLEYGASMPSTPKDSDEIALEESEQVNNLVRHKNLK
ncbi:hypothetical protein F4803DRAFT_120273 [Xylaria telfairii]|nr:hypothetical protein F4803DRAFT_120273 [Xylaria telfairii]